MPTKHLTRNLIVAVAAMMTTCAATAQERLPWDQGGAVSRPYPQAGVNSDAYRPPAQSGYGSGQYPSGQYPSGQSGGSYGANEAYRPPAQSGGGYQGSGGYQTSQSGGSYGNDAYRPPSGYQSQGGYQGQGGYSSQGGSYQGGGGSYGATESYGAPSQGGGYDRYNYSGRAPDDRAGQPYSRGGEPYPAYRDGNPPVADYNRGPPPGYRGDGGGYPPPQYEDRRTYSQNEVLAAGHGFFGSVSKGLANVIEYAFQKAGRPNGYILGEDAGGAFVAGLRYGEGVLYTKDAGSHKVFWQGPSIGYDFGAEGSKTMVLVYNLRDPQEIYDRFAGVQGSAYLVGGVGIQFQKGDGDITLAPIRAGVGLRLGANVGYLKYTRSPTWNPF
jgi:hypothetical protein